VKNKIPAPTGKAQSIPLRAALLVAVVALSLLTTSAANAQTPTATPNPIPPKLTAQAGEGKIHLQWAAVTGASRYELWIWTEAGGWVQRDDGALTDTSFQHTDATPGAEYFYAVRAIAADGPAGEWSNFPTVTLPETQTEIQLETQFALSSLADTSDADPTATPTATPTPESPERAALVAIYNATGGANWTRSTNWLSDKPISTWYGVTLDSAGRVGELRLSTNNLTGSFPNLNALTRVRVIDFGANNLTGSIPNLSALTNLGGLDLTSNQLTGSIPNLSALTKMTHLYLANNNLSGTIPASLGAISRLNTLYLGRNHLTGCIPVTLRDVEKIGRASCRERV